MDAAFVAAASALERPGSPHRFVCKLFASQVREAAQLGGSPAGTHFALLRGADGTPLAGAFFYPRPDDDAGGASGGKHAYVELIVASVPGRGYGSLLLGEVERFVGGGGLGLGPRPAQAAARCRVLAVEGAQRFYERHGYCPPDAATREMQKVLAA